MKIYLLLFISLIPISSFSFNDDNADKVSACNYRIESAVPPNFPRHQEWAIKKHGACAVNVNLSIDENGEKVINHSYAKNTDCKYFIKNSRISVEQYTFKKGINETCELIITYEFDTNDS